MESFHIDIAYQVPYLCDVAELQRAYAFHVNSTQYANEL